MNKNQTIGILILIAIIIIGGFFLFTRSTHAPENLDIDDLTNTTFETTEEEIPAQQEQVANTNNSGTSKQTNKNPIPNPDLYATVTYTESGFFPSTLTITEGDEVFFWNKSEDFLWIASENHTTHTAYPDTDIDNCGTPEAKGGFDSCGNVAVKNGWTFVFTEKGSWVYHDHNDPVRQGTIIVQ